VVENKGLINTLNKILMEENNCMPYKNLEELFKHFEEEDAKHTRVSDAVREEVLRNIAERKRRKTI
jgi:hypothetical protein